MLIASAEYQDLKQKSVITSELHTNHCRGEPAVTKGIISYTERLMERIRNFCIIAQVDNGKSTLADRMLQMTHTIADRDMTAQVLDTMDKKKKKGVITSKTVQKFESKNLTHSVQCCIMAFRCPGESWLGFIMYTNFPVPAR